uniref:Decapping nuclease n=1 Tax=Spumella elongata TaxID=89044 RepID=A0A7S3M3T2_9STRA
MASADITLRVVDLHCVIPTEPILHLPVMVASSNYGTDKVDVIVPYASPAILNPPPKNRSVKFDTEPMPWNKNPIDRTLAPPLPAPKELTIFTNRHNLLSLLYIFMFHPSNYYHENQSFRVSRVGNTVYFLDGPLGEDPGPMPDKGYPGAFGVPFEKLVSTQANPAVEKFFVFHTYTLLAEICLLVRAEVDCVYKKDPKSADLGVLTEIKSKKNNKRYPVWSNTDYFRTVWAQMLFGCTESLIIGTYNANSAGDIATFDNISQLTFMEVADYANMREKEKNYLYPLTQLATLLKWIKDNVGDGENKTFTYSKGGRLFTLSSI